MKWFVRVLGAIVVVSLVTSALLVGAAALFGTSFDGGVIQIDDATFTLGELGALGAAHWALAFAAVAFGCVIAIVVVPFAVIVPFACAAVAVTLVLGIAAAVTAIVCSPLILLGWIVWRLLRRPAAATDPTALAR